MSPNNNLINVVEKEELLSIQDEVREIIDFVDKQEQNEYLDDEKIISAKLKFRQVVLRERNMIRNLENKYGFNNGASELVIQ